MVFKVAWSIMCVYEYIYIGAYVCTSVYNHLFQKPRSSCLRFISRYVLCSY